MPKIFDLNGQAGNSNGDSKLRSVVLNSLRKGAPILEYAEFYTMQGNADAPPKVTMLSGGEFRAINSPYTGETSAPDYGSIVLKVMGGKVKTDVAYERRGQDLASVHLSDVTNYSEALGRKFMDAFINSSFAATTFKGLKARIPESQLVQFDTVNGGVLPSGNASADVKQQHKFVELLRKWVARTRPTVITANSDLISRITTLAYANVRLVTVTDALTQQSVNIPYFGNVPLLDSGWNVDESGLVIPNTETCGTSTTCTSLYGIRFGEKKDVTLASNVGVQVDTVKNDNFAQTTIDFDVDMEVLSDKSVFRIEGVMFE